MIPEKCGTTHYAGCPCHEARRDAKHGATILELAAVRDLLGRLRAAFFASDLVKRDVLDDVDAYLSAHLDALAQAAQDDGQYNPPKVLTTEEAAEQFEREGRLTFEIQPDGTRQTVRYLRPEDRN